MRFSPQLAAGMLIAAVGGMTWRRPPTAADIITLTESLKFTRTALITPAANRPATLHLAPALAQLERYLTAFVPMGVALADLAGDGVPNVVCAADPVAGTVTVAPIPGSKHPFPAFTLPPPVQHYDVAAMRPTGCLPGDFHETGTQDLLVYYFGRTPSVYRHIRSTELSAAAFVVEDLIPMTDTSKPWYTMSMTTADVDGDGHLDLIAAEYFPDTAELFRDHAASYAVMNDSLAIADNGGHPRLFLADPQVPGRFIDHSDALALTGSQWATSVGAADIDGDLLPEIYFACDHGPDHFLHNLSRPGAPAFALLNGTERDLYTPPSKVLGKDAFHGMGVEFGDLNLDGKLDIMVSNISVDHMLHENNFVWIQTDANANTPGVAPFVDQAEQLGLARSGWAWEVRIADFDNSGVPQVFQSVGMLRGTVNRIPELHETALGNDFFLKNPEVWHHYNTEDDIAGGGANAFYKRGEGGKYVNIGANVWPTEPAPSRGATVGDTDGDGRMRLIVANEDGNVLLYRNVAAKIGSFLGLDIRLAYDAVDTSNVHIATGRTPVDNAHRTRPAIGTMVRIERPDHVKTIAQVDGGSGLGGKRAPEVHFGLGTTQEDADIKVQLDWRGPRGEPHSYRFTTHPGWYTVTLGTYPGLAEVRP